MTNTHGNPINYEARIFRDPQICGGEPVFKGTRVTLRTVLGNLGDGVADSWRAAEARRPR
jgi:uncharacterized protein (DUF433 family)